MLDVILGAVVMLVGVIVGFVLVLAAVNSKEEKKSETLHQLPLSLYSNKDSHPKSTIDVRPSESHLIDSRESLDKALKMLREHHGPIPQDVGDSIEETITAALTNLQPQSIAR